MADFKIDIGAKLHNEDLNKIKGKLDRFFKQINNQKPQIGNKIIPDDQVDKVKRQMQAVQDVINKYESKGSGKNNSTIEKLKKHLEQLKSAFKSVGKEQEKIGKTKMKVDKEEFIRDVNKAEEELKDFYKLTELTKEQAAKMLNTTSLGNQAGGRGYRPHEVDKVSAQSSVFKNEQGQEVELSLTRIQDKWGKIITVARTYNKELNKIERSTVDVEQDTEKWKDVTQETVRQMASNLSLTEARQEINQTADAIPRIGEAHSQTMRGVDKESKNFFSEVKTSFTQMIKWNVAGKIFQGLEEGFQAAIEYIKELDKSLTAIATVRGMDRNEIAALGEEFNRMAQDMGRNTKEMAEASEIFFRQGKQTAEVLELVKATTIAASVAGTDMKQTSEYLTAALNGFKIEASDAMDVIDKFSAIGANSGSSFQEIAYGLTKVASGANNAGIDIDHMMSMIATTSEITRESAENIGTSFKTIIARMTAVKDGGEGTSEVLNKVDKALKTVNIQLRKSDGQMRPLQDVIAQLGEKWHALDGNTKSYLATTIAGTRQQNRLIAYLDNYDRSLEILNTSLTSTGAATEQFATHMDGLEAKLGTMHAQIESMFSAFANSEGLGYVVTIIGDMAGGVGKLIDEFGILGGLLPSIFAIALVSSKSFRNSLKDIKDSLNFKSVKLFSPSEFRNYEESLRKISGLTSEIKQKEQDLQVQYQRKWVAQSKGDATKVATAEKNIMSLQREIATLTNHRMEVERNTAEIIKRTNSQITANNVISTGVANLKSGTAALMQNTEAMKGFTGVVKSLGAAFMFAQVFKFFHQIGEGAEPIKLAQTAIQLLIGGIVLLDAATKKMAATWVASIFAIEAATPVFGWILAAVTAIGLAVAALIPKWFDFRSETEKLTDEMDSLNKSLEKNNKLIKEADNVERLADEYARLNKILKETNDLTEEQRKQHEDKLADIAAQIADANPELADGIDEKGRRTVTNQSTIDRIVEEKREKARKSVKAFKDMGYGQATNVERLDLVNQKIDDTRQKLKELNLDAAKGVKINVDLKETYEKELAQLEKDKDRFERSGPSSDYETKMQILQKQISEQEDAITTETLENPQSKDLEEMHDKLNKLTTAYKTMQQARASVKVFEQGEIQRYIEEHQLKTEHTNEEGEALQLRLYTLQDIATWQKTLTTQGYDEIVAQNVLRQLYDETQESIRSEIAMSAEKRITLKRNHEENIEEINRECDALKLELEAKKNSVEGTKEEIIYTQKLMALSKYRIDQINKEKDARAQLLDATGDTDEVLKKSTKNYKESKTHMEFYTKVLEELDSEHKNSQETIDKIIEDYPDLFDAIGQEVPMREAVKAAIEEETGIVQDNLIAKLGASESWFETEVLNNEALLNAMNLAYGEDAKTFKAACDLKEVTNNKMALMIGDVWNKLAGTTSEKLTFIKNNIDAIEAQGLPKGVTREDLLGQVDKFSEVLKPIDLELKSDAGNIFKKLNFSKKKKGSEYKSKALNKYAAALKTINDLYEEQEKIVKRLENQIKIKQLHAETEEDRLDIIKTQNELIAAQRKQQDLLNQSYNNTAAVQEKIRKEFQSKFGLDLAKSTESDLVSYFNSKLDNKKSEKLQKIFKDLKSDYEKAGKQSEKFLDGIASIEQEISNAIDKKYKDYIEGHREEWDLMDDTIGDLQDNIDLLSTSSEHSYMAQAKMNKGMIETAMRQRNSYIATREAMRRMMVEAGEGTEEWKKAAKYIGEVNEMIDEQNKNLFAYSEAIEELQQQAKDFTNEVHDDVAAMMVKEKDDYIDLLDEKLNRFKQNIDDQIKAMEDAESRADWSDTLNDKQTKIIDVQKELNDLQYRDDIDAKNRKLELQKKLADAEKDLRKTQRKHDIDERKTDLQNQVSEQEKKLNVTKSLLAKEYNERNALLKAHEAMQKGFYTTVGGEQKKLQDSMEEYHKSMREHMFETGESIKKNIVENLKEANELMSNGMAYGAQFGIGNDVGIKLIDDFKTELIGALRQFNPYVPSDLTRDSQTKHLHPTEYHPGDNPNGDNYNITFQVQTISNIDKNSANKFAKQFIDATSTLGGVSRRR